VTDIVVKQPESPTKSVFHNRKRTEELKRWLREYDYGNRNSPLCMKVFFSGELPKEENIERLREIKNEAQQA